MLSNTLGKRLKALRKQHNLNQLELSEKLSIQRQTLSAYERGISIPNIFILIRLADIYDLTLDELVDRKRFQKNLKTTCTSFQESKFL